MKKATLVMATIVAFLLSGSVFAARKTITDIPTIQTIFMGPGIPTSTGGVLTVPGGMIGEYIPAPTNKSISIIPKTSVPVAKIGSLAKGVAKGGIAGIAIGYAWDEMMEGLDWVMQDGAIVKKSSGSPGTWKEGQLGYMNPYNGAAFSTPEEACKSVALVRGQTYISNAPSAYGDYNCQGRYPGGSSESMGDVQRLAGSCPAGTAYSNAVGYCVGSTGTAPLVESDYTILDGFIQGKDGVWQRDLTNELCNGRASCYQALEPSTVLTGPVTVTGVPSTQTTTSSTGTSTTTTTTPTTSITYGSNYYDYTTTTTTTTNNGAGDTTTTKDDTDISMPVPPNIFGGANGGLGGIKDGIPTESSSVSPLPYMPWWSFSQSCTEVTFVIPVYGAVTTKNCPIYEKYIWPVLYFIFAVFTWLTCWGIWRNTVLHVRAS